MILDGNMDLTKEWRALEIVIAKGKMQIVSVIISISLKIIDHLIANNSSVVLGL